MQLRGLILSLQEFNIANEKDPERFVMEDGLTELLDGLYRYQVQIINLDLFHAYSVEKLQMILQLYQIEPKECLLFAASDQILALAEKMDIASLGYLNTKISGQKLRQAQMLLEGFDEVDFHFLERMYQRKHGIPWQVIETERCYLREITIDDLDDLYELYQGKTITKYMEGLYEERKKEEEYTRAYIKNMYQFYGYGMWVAIQKSTGKLIGRAGLDNSQLHGKIILQMGYVVGEAFQNQGYATELCQGILKYAREETEFDEIHCLIHKENKISIHLAQKLGFIWQEEVKIHGKYLQRYTKSLQFGEKLSIM